MSTINYKTYKTLRRPLRGRRRVLDLVFNCDKVLMKDYHINIFYSEDDEGYIADTPDLQFCSAFGATLTEALQDLEIAKQAWLDTARSLIL